MKNHIDIALLWFTATTIFSLPFFASDMDFATAFFEAASALSSVGITSISDENFLFSYRAFLSFVGGILFLITLPHLISTSDSFKFAIHENFTVKRTVKTYFFLYILGVILYFLFGENLQNSLIISALSVSTAGGINIPENLIIPASFMMFLSVIFPLIYVLSDLKYNVTSIIKREQFKVLVTAFSVILLYFSLKDIAVDRAFFYIVSFISTTGFLTENVFDLDQRTIYIFFILSFMGGLIGSPGGGIKIFRLIIIFRILLVELRHTLNPRMVTVIKLNQRPAPNEIIAKVLIFFFLYTSVIFAFSVVLTLFEIKYEDAALISFSLLTTTGILPLKLKETVLNFGPLLKIITTFFFMTIRLKIFILFIAIQYFYEQINSSGVHSWKKQL